MYRFAKPFAEIKTTEYFDPIPTSFYSKLTCKINAIVPIKIGHTYKINIPIDMEELFSFPKIYADKTGSYQSNHSICAHLRCFHLRSSAGNLSCFSRRFSQIFPLIAADKTNYFIANFPSAIICDVFISVNLREIFFLFPADCR